MPHAIYCIFDASVLSSAESISNFVIPSYNNITQPSVISFSDTSEVSSGAQRVVCS